MAKQLKTAFIEDGAVDKTKLNADVASTSISGGAGAALAIIPDATGGANLAKAIDSNANGVAVKVDDATVEGNPSDQLQVKDNGIGAIQIDLTGTYDYSGGNVQVGAPSVNNDVANKAYVDALVAGASVKDACRAATTAVLADAYTYDNGASGVGATLTKTTNGAFPAQDGITLAQDERVLIKDETGGNAPYNGIYTLTQVGDVSNPWILTRATDNDEADEFAGAFTFIQEGTINEDNGWLCTTDTPITVGTTDITWTQFSGAGSVVAGTGLTKSGNELRVGDGSTGNINGINRAADDISAAVDDTTIEIVSNLLQIKDGGVSAAKLGSDVKTYFTEILTLDGTDISNKYKALSSTPVDVTLGTLTPLSGMEQERVVDFVIQIGPDRVDWNGLGLDGVLIAGDKLSITYAI